MINTYNEIKFIKSLLITIYNITTLIISWTSNLGYKVILH